ncbi:putative FAD dependent oxidoreductase [Rosellinia necatrix]|uniref:Putative FAD dependent oxidoreductase n=1 Tax=Rosellinia necatrix TaxID=77044 RepID=A0A1W2TFD4_ROSNE|nr:putative FAD dependent oxidoreductase [Rosellinia necatrix]
MASGTDSYLIVGAGVFGVSTAFTLIQKYPNASVTLVDRDAYDAESRVAASWDWNKVVRADYDDIIYCELALEAQDVFKSDPLWKPYFHETGLIWTCRDDYAKSVIENYKRLGRKADIKAVTVEEARKLYGGLFEEADYTGVTEVLINPTGGWGAAGDSLRAITRRAIELGVKYEVAEVATLLLDKKGKCSGIKTRMGRAIKATHTIICAGAYTPTLLEYSAVNSGLPNIAAGFRLLAGGITTGMAKLDDDSHAVFGSMPVAFQGYRPEQGPFIGSLPPTPDSREMKWWGQTIFKNTREILPGHWVSSPPPKPDYAQWEVSKRLKEDIQYANKAFYGKKTAHWKLDKFRICWDAFTTSSDFIISPHSASKGLYIATGGSFHGYKFFPVIGKYIVQMLEGQLSPQLTEKWAWDRQRPDPALFPDWPRFEMKDLADPVRTSKL